MRGNFKKIPLAAAATALLVSPTAALASSASPAPASTASAWSTLSAIGSATSSSASLAAVQGDMDYRDDDRGIPLPVIAVIGATLGLFIWILVHDDDDSDLDEFIRDPISPD